MPGCWLVLIGLISLRTLGQTPPPPLTPTQIAIQWANLSLATIQSSPNNSPTYASRSLAYLGIAMYESVVHSDTTYRSLAGQLSGLQSLPGVDTSQVYNWGLVLNAAQASLLYKLYPHAYRHTVVRIDSLQRAVMGALSASERTDVVERSAVYGWALADVIFEWSKSDGGHAGFDRNFDASYVLPKGDGYWVPPVGGQSPVRAPLHPTWGSNRPFVPTNGQLAMPPPFEYATDSLSTCYREFNDVYRKSLSLTTEEKATAIWWADDPSQTAAPAGHSYNIATAVIRLAKPNVVKAAATYARVGMAVADAFINCWKCKYIYHRERPSTFISRVVQKGWKPFWPEPPFPAYSSGHSTQAAAAATVLSGLYGERFTVVDSTHCGRLPEPITGLSYAPRRFETFWAMATECANSRFYGGIHTAFDNTTGLAEGRKIGQHINALRWLR